jgi:hypothetical protein
MKLPRRYFLFLSGIGLSAAWLFPKKVAEGSVLDPLKDSVIRNSRVLELGAACAKLLGLSAEETREKLLFELSQQGLGTGASAREALAAATRKDFEQGDLLSLRGWPVSRTEALAYSHAYFDSAVRR